LWPNTRKNKIRNFISKISLLASENVRKYEKYNALLFRCI